MFRANLSTAETVTQILSATFYTMYNNNHYKTQKSQLTCTVGKRVSTPRKKDIRQQPQEIYHMLYFHTHEVFPISSFGPESFQGLLTHPPDPLTHSIRQLGWSTLDITQNTDEELIVSKLFAE